MQADADMTERTVGLLQSVFCSISGKEAVLFSLLSEIICLAVSAATDFARSRDKPRQSRLLYGGLFVSVSAGSCTKQALAGEEQGVIFYTISISNINRWKGHLNHRMQTHNMEFSSWIPVIFCTGDSARVTV